MPSLKPVSHAHVLLVSQGVLVIHVCEKLNDRQKLSSFSPPLSSSSYYCPPPLHSSLCPYSLPFLPANWCCTTPFISPPCLQKCSLGQRLSAASRGPCWKTSRMFKKLTHPIPPAGLCSPTGDFTMLMTGNSLPSWAHINLSVDTSYSLILKLLTMVCCAAGEGKPSLASTS